MPSNRLDQLKKQIDVLRSHLLPRDFDPTGTYENQDQVSTQALAFRVLAHAEIESYFEDRTLEAVAQARHAWEKGVVTRTAACLFAFCGRELSAPPETLVAPSENKRKDWPSKIDVSAKFVPIASGFHNLVRNENHGIKERNLMSLLIPIGFHHDKFDPALLADLDSFGALRGAAAHSSRGMAATQSVDPRTELERVTKLYSGIDAVDAQFDALMDA